MIVSPGWSTAEPYVYRHSLTQATWSMTKELQEDGEMVEET